MLAFISKVLEEYIDNCIIFLKGVNDNSNVIYTELDLVYNEILNIFNIYVISADP